MDQFENKNHENVEERSDERKQHVQYYADGQMAGSREELEKAQPLQIVASADELLNFFV